MNSKLIGVFVAVLAVVALVAFPAGAMAEDATLEYEETEVPLESGAPFNMFSTNLEFKLASGVIVVCNENEISGTVGAASPLVATLEMGRFEGGGSAGWRCLVAGSNKRYEASFSEVSFKASLKFRKILGKVQVDPFTMNYKLEIWDIAADPKAPLFNCQFDVTLGSTVAGDKLLSTGEPELKFGGPACLGGPVTGEFRMTSEGMPLKVS
jgi:hypothetical protein